VKQDRKATVLVVDDDAPMRGFIRELLTQHGYQVFEAADGQEGLQMFEGNPADLVITDLFMPKKEGCETILELRRRWPGMKIIAMSGGSRDGHDFLPIARALGAQRTLYKPILTDELLQAVHEVLNRESGGGSDRGG
jgi:DNA-binding response OmpR family regulator